MRFNPTGTYSGFICDGPDEKLDEIDLFRLGQDSVERLELIESGLSDDSARTCPKEVNKNA